MKLGSFVSKSAKDITTNDIVKFTAILRDYFHPAFHEVKIDNRTWDIVKSTRDKERACDDVFVKCVFSHRLPEYIYGVNRKGDTIKFRGFDIDLHHRTGVCQNEEEAAHGIEDSYEIWVTIDGCVKEYKSSQVRKIEIKGRFQYNTDYSEFDFSLIKKEIEDLMKFQHSSPSQLKKIKMKMDKYKIQY